MRVRVRPTVFTPDETADLDTPPSDDTLYREIKTRPGVDKAKPKEWYWFCL